MQTERERVKESHAVKVDEEERISRERERHCKRTEPIPSPLKGVLTVRKECGHSGVSDPKNK